MQKETDQWYTSWFDTSYYHTLYRDRDYEEAGLFMNQLTSFLKLKPGNSILDLACGKGRHSVYLNRMGFDVTGIDLSPSSIKSASKYQSESLRFKVHDMCVPYPGKFDAVFNLFTSFGYFEKDEDNLRTIKAIKEELKPGGYGVIDFLNVQYVSKNLVSSEEKLVDGIRFKIDRKIEDGYIVKNISFDNDGKSFNFMERVQALSLDDFRNYFTKAQLNLEHHFGDYHLNEFSAQDSERLILIFN